MAGRADKGMFMMKNKRIRKILDDLDNYTEADLYKEKIPHWSRKILIDMKKGEVERVLTTREYVQAMIDNSPAPVTHDFKMYQFIAPTQFICGLEVIEGEYVLLTDDKTIKVTHHEMPKEHFEGKIVFVEEVESVEVFWIKKRDKDWERLCPNEERVVEQQPNEGLFQIRRIE